MLVRAGFGVQPPWWASYPQGGGAALAAPSSLVSCASATGVLVDEFVQQAGNGWINLVATYLQAGQSFQSGASPRALTGICFPLLKIGSPEGRLYAHIYAHSTGTLGAGTATGDPLVSSVAFQASGLTTSLANYFFALSGWTPAASTPYVAVIDATAVVGDASNFVRLAMESDADATHAGRAQSYTTAVGWGAIVGTDAAFKVYEAAAATATAVSYARRGLTVRRR